MAKYILFLTISFQNKMRYYYLQTNKIPSYFHSAIFKIKIKFSNIFPNGNILCQQFIYFTSSNVIRCLFFKPHFTMTLCCNILQVYLQAFCLTYYLESAKACLTGLNVNKERFDLYDFVTHITFQMYILTMPDWPYGFSTNWE